MAFLHTMPSSANTLHNHNNPNLDLDQIREMVLGERIPTSVLNSSNNILILHLPMATHLCQTQLYTILRMVPISHNMLCHITCNNLHRCKVLRKEFLKAGHSIQITVRPLNNILIHK